MSTWPDTRILDLLGIDVPIIQAPMAGATSAAMVIAANQAGALGSIPAAMLSIEQLHETLATVRHASSGPINVNFFCHQPPEPDEERNRHWKALLEPYYRELGADFDAPTPVSNRAPFNAASCEVVEQHRPEVVSFHFGLPEKTCWNVSRRPEPRCCPRPPRSRKRSGWSGTAATRLSPWGMRPAGIGECSWLRT